MKRNVFTVFTVPIVTIDGFLTGLIGDLSFSFVWLRRLTGCGLSLIWTENNSKIRIWTLILTQTRSSLVLVFCTGSRIHWRLSRLLTRSSGTLNPSIVTIGSMKTVKTFFLAFPALNSTAMSKKRKHSNSYPIINDFECTGIILFVTRNVICNFTRGVFSYNLLLIIKIVNSLVKEFKCMISKNIRADLLWYMTQSESWNKLYTTMTY